METLHEIGEFGLIERLARMIPSAPAVLEGVGDDCAVVRIGNRLLLVSCDLSIENVHFRRPELAPEAVGWKAAASGLSDIAAMGGAPLFSLVSLACPADADVAVLERIYTGMLDAFSERGVALVGGDTTRSETGITLDVTVIGEVIGNRYLARKGALAGDVLAVTGRLGLSAGGLHALESGEEAPALVHAHYHPTARIPEGQWLSASPDVHAMLDISDGLVQDALHLGKAAHLGLDIDPERLLVDAQLAQYCQERGLDPYAFILAGGEDYELAFAVDPKSCQDTLRAFRRQFRTEVNAVGVFTDEWQEVRVAGRPVAKGGFDHFKGIRPRT